MAMYSPEPSPLETIAEQLAYPMFPCKPFVAIDTIVVVSLFGQKKTKGSSRTHRMQTFALGGPGGVDPDVNNLVYSAFEQRKDSLNFNNAIEYFEIVDNITEAVYTSGSPINVYGPHGRIIFRWCIAAYALAINRESSVKSSCVRMGPDNIYGFAIHARKQIREGMTLHELIGLMPKDDNAKYVEVSVTQSSEFNNQSPNEKRALFGPIRYINHICRGANAAFVAEKDTSAFYVYATRTIEANEEIFLDYGAGWFEKEPGGCPCLACKPDQQESKRPKIEKDAATIEAEKKDARRAKRQKQKEKKKSLAVAGPSSSGAQ